MGVFRIIKTLEHRIYGEGSNKLRMKIDTGAVDEDIFAFQSMLQHFIHAKEFSITITPSTIKVFKVETGARRIQRQTKTLYIKACIIQLSDVGEIEILNVAIRRRIKPGIAV